MSESPVLEIFLPNENATLRFAAWMSQYVDRGDILVLDGDLGVGKTCFARGFIQRLCGQDTEVVSPSFTLVQTYKSLRFNVLHADLYRLEKPQDAEELGIFSELEHGVVLLEWAERLGTFLEEDYIKITLTEHHEGRLARLTMSAFFLEKFSAFNAYVERENDLTLFLKKHGWALAERIQIAGDASSRRYEKLTYKGESIILMDWLPDSNDYGKEYRISVSLADSTSSFVAVADILNRFGLSSPKCFAHDSEKGFLLLEDFGQDTMTRFIDSVDAKLPIFYRESVAALAHLHRYEMPEYLPVLDDREVRLPHYDKNVIKCESEMFLKWYMPYIGYTVHDEAYHTWFVIWDKLSEQLKSLPSVLVIRDFHSPNLHWLNERQTIARVGIIDVQDALLGSPAYDMVSLLQDARCEVDAQLRENQIQFYLEKTSVDEENFRASFAILGLQRNLRIAGVFVRLAEKDKKLIYLSHLPRVLGYIKENLLHPAVSEVREWLDKNLAGVL